MEVDPVETPEKEIEKEKEKDQENKLTEEEKKYVKVYPIYIDKDLKYSRGRKINLELCVEKPTQCKYKEYAKNCLD